MHSQPSFSPSYPHWHSHLHMHSQPSFPATHIGIPIYICTPSPHSQLPTLAFPSTYALPALIPSYPHWHSHLHMHSQPSFPATHIGIPIYICTPSPHSQLPTLAFPSTYALPALIQSHLPTLAFPSTYALPALIPSYPHWHSHLHMHSQPSFPATHIGIPIYICTPSPHSQLPTLAFPSTYALPALIPSYPHWHSHLHMHSQPSFPTSHLASFNYPPSQLASSLSVLRGSLHIWINTESTPIEQEKHMYLGLFPGE